MNTSKYTHVLFSHNRFNNDILKLFVPKDNAIVGFHAVRREGNGYKPNYGPTIKIGKIYTLDKIKLCNRGFHGCFSPMHCSGYLNSSYFHINKYWGNGELEHDKFVFESKKPLKLVHVKDIFVQLGLLSIADPEPTMYSLRNRMAESPDMERRIMDHIYNLMRPL